MANPIGKCEQHCESFYGMHCYAKEYYDCGETYYTIRYPNSDLDNEVPCPSPSDCKEFDNPYFVVFWVICIPVMLACYICMCKQYRKNRRQGREAA